jgi:hypothetical protein
VRADVADDEDQEAGDSARDLGILWTQAQVERYLEAKERELEAAYTASPLPVTPDLEALQSLLLSCLEQHYGSLDGCIARDNDALRALRDIDTVLDRVRGLLR